MSHHNKLYYDLGVYIISLRIGGPHRCKRFTWCKRCVYSWNRVYHLHENPLSHMWTQNTFEWCQDYQKLHNFISQLVTWRVMIGEGVSVDHMETYFHQSQLTTWRIVAQKLYHFLCPSIFQYFLVGVVGWTHLWHGKHDSGTIWLEFHWHLAIFHIHVRA